jgi:imidazolonepropionase-like amidohydrolase
MWLSRSRNAPGATIARFALLVGLMCSSASFAQIPRTGAPHRAIAIENVTLIPMTENSVTVRDATVVIENGRIASLRGPVPKGAQRINGKGKWLIPGLTDMHVHLPSDEQLPRDAKYVYEGLTEFFSTQDMMTPYVANGVTQIVDMSAFGSSFGQRIEIARGTVLGPQMILAAAIHGGRTEGRVANTPSDGRQSVRDAKADGYDVMKTYSGLSAEVFLAVVDEANKQGMKVVGHIPDAFTGKLEAAFMPGFAMIAHAEELSKHSSDFTDADALRFAQLAKQNGTWLSPTLTAWRWIASQTRSLDELKALPTLKYVHPLIRGRWVADNGYNRASSPPSQRRIEFFNRMEVFHRKLVRAFKAESVPMVAGTDALTSGVVAGFSLHEELELLVDAGLTNEEALASATRVPAVWLGVAADRGTIEVGKRADLVLLHADPLVAITNTRKIAGVFLGGRWVNRTTLDTMMKRLAERNAATAGLFDWQKVKKE